MSEKSLLCLGPPPPLSSLPFASSITSLAPGPRTSVAPESSATRSPWSPPCFSSALCWRALTSSRRLSTFCCSASADAVSDRTPVDEFLAFLGHHRGCHSGLRGADRHHRGDQHQTRGESELGVAATVAPPPGLLRCAGPSPRRNRRRGCDPSRCSAATSTHRDAEAARGYSRWGAAAACRTSSHVAVTASQRPHRCGGAPWIDPVRHSAAVSVTCAVHHRGPFVEQCLRGCVVRSFRPQMRDCFGRSRAAPSPSGRHVSTTRTPSVVSTDRSPAASTTVRITSPLTAQGVARSRRNTCARGIRASI